MRGGLPKGEFRAFRCRGECRRGQLEVTPAQGFLDKPLDLLEGCPAEPRLLLLAAIENRHDLVPALVYEFIGFSLSRLAELPEIGLDALTILGLARFELSPPAPEVGLGLLRPGTLDDAYMIALDAFGNDDATVVAKVGDEEDEEVGCQEEGQEEKNLHRTWYLEGGCRKDDADVRASGTSPGDQYPGSPGCGIANGDGY